MSRINVRTEIDIELAAEERAILMQSYVILKNIAKEIKMEEMQETYQAQRVAQVLDDLLLLNFFNTKNFTKDLEGEEYKL